MIRTLKYERAPLAETIETQKTINTRREKSHETVNHAPVVTLALDALDALSSSRALSFVRLFFLYLFVAFTLFASIYLVFFFFTTIARCKRVYRRLGTKDSERLKLSENYCDVRFGILGVDKIDGFRNFRILKWMLVNLTEDIFFFFFRSHLFHFLF